MRPSVRRSNLGLVLGEIHRRGVVSRSELGAVTGLTRSSILSLVGALVDRGLVSESRAASTGSPGRPSSYVRPVSTAAVALAMEIAVDSLTVATVGLGGAMIDRVRQGRPRSSGVDETLDGLAAMAAGALGRLHHTTRLVGVGVAVAGQVASRDGHLTLAPNLGWRDVPLGRHITRRLAVDVPLAVANEARLGALAEHRRGAAVGCDDVIYVGGDVGVGGGLIIGGRPFAGATGTAGEIGHMIVDPRGLDCRCGSRGCWETVVSRQALLARVGLGVDAGPAGVAGVAARAQAGEPAALAALDETADWMAVGLVGLVNLINPQLIVLGGYFPLVAPLWRPDLVSRIRRSVLPSCRPDLRIVSAHLGTDASLLGAAELAFEHLLADPLR